MRSFRTKEIAFILQRVICCLIYLSQNRVLCGDVNDKNKIKIKIKCRYIVPTARSFAYAVLHHKLYFSRGAIHYVAFVKIIIKNIHFSLKSLSILINH